MLPPFLTPGQGGGAADEGRQPCGEPRIGKEAELSKASPLWSILAAWPPEKDFASLSWVPFVGWKPRRGVTYSVVYKRHGLLC